MSSSNRSPTIVVLGAINMDLVGIADRMPVEGETVVGQSFFTTPGGKGANQAVAAAKLGAQVRMVGRVGEDSFGPQLLADLEGYGINVAGVARDSENASGIAIILLDPSGQNRIVAIYGANAACDEAQLDAAKAAMDGADALMLQLEVPVDISIAAAEHARATGVAVVWDPAPARDMPDSAFRLADVLTPNQTEAEHFTGIAVSDQESGRRAAEALLTRGVGTAVVKLGAIGAYFASADESAFVPAHAVDTVDTIAAGDAFGAGLAVAMSEGKEMAAAVRFGAAGGAIAVTKPGAQTAMPTRREIEALLSRP